MALPHRMERLHRRPRLGLGLCGLGRQFAAAYVLFERAAAVWRGKSKGTEGRERSDEMVGRGGRALEGEMRTYTAKSIPHSDKRRRLARSSQIAYQLVQRVLPRRRRR
eukprot:SAG11_NODE_4207_length_2013_cov_34.543365_2_plen_108_part_00